MLKRSLIYLLLSILVIIFSKFAHMLVIYIDMLYAYINIKLLPIFSQGSVGIIIRKIILLLLIPVTITGVPALGYRLIKGKDMPYFFESTWCVWLVVLLSNILIRL